MSASAAPVQRDYSAQPPFLYVLDADPMPFPALLNALDALGVTFRREGESLALKNGPALSPALQNACRDHKAELLALCDLRADVAQISDRIETLRAGDPPKGTRAQGLEYLRRCISALAARCDLDDGFTDSDPFAAEVIGILRAQLATVEGVQPARLAA